MTVVTLTSGTTSWLVPADWSTSNTIVATGGAGGEVVSIGAANLIPGSTVAVQIGAGKTTLFGNTDEVELVALPGSGGDDGQIVATYTPTPARTVTPYHPNTGVATREVPYLAMVTQNDPLWARRKHRELEYVWANGRTHYADPTTRGAFNNNPD